MDTFFYGAGLLSPIFMPIILYFLPKLVNVSEKRTSVPKVWFSVLTFIGYIIFIAGGMILMFSIPFVLSSFSGIKGASDIPFILFLNVIILIPFMGVFYVGWLLRDIGRRGRLIKGYVSFNDEQERNEE